MDKLINFKNLTFGEIRVINKNGEAWFIGKDVAEKLGYKDSFGALKKHVDEEDKQNCQNSSFKSNRGLTIINESGLYSLVLTSKLPGAKAFKRWITSEVLPAIRRDGGYIKTTEEDTDEMIMAKALMIGKKTIERQKQLLEEKENTIAEQNLFLDKVSASMDCILVRDVAHLLTKQGFKIGEKRLWEKLRELKLIQKGTTKPYQRALEQGLFQVNEYAIQTNHGVKLKTTTKVTGKGQVHIIKKVMEQVN